MRDYLKDEEYIKCVGDILDSKIFKKLDTFVQHGSTSTMEHSIDVSYRTFLICKEHKLNYKSAARAALLHDFYLYDWHRPAKETGVFLHGFTHPYVACRNAEKEFLLNNIEKDIIKKHMFPLTPVPPRYKESWIVTAADKLSASYETVEIFLRKYKKS